MPIKKMKIRAGGKTLELRVDVPLDFIPRSKSNGFKYVKAKSKKKLA